MKLALMLTLSGFPNGNLQRCYVLLQISAAKKLLHRWALTCSALSDVFISQKLGKSGSFSSPLEEKFSI